MMCQLRKRLCFPKVMSETLTLEARLIPTLPAAGFSKQVFERILRFVEVLNKELKVNESKIIRIVTRDNLLIVL